MKVTAARLLILFLLTGLFAAAGRQLFSCPGGDPVRKEDAKILFVPRDGKYYPAEFWCVSDRRVATAEFDHGGQTTAGQREVQLSYP